jgi:hypothetical protein
MLTRDEAIRRVRLGDIKKLLRSRCGFQLPDDDAGREYLYELLLPISLGAEPNLKMENVMAVWAPWMDASERFELVAQIERMPAYMRKIRADALGERLRLTREERGALRLRTIAAFDVTDEQRAVGRRVKKRARDERRRRLAGSKPRTEYLAASASQRKPWEAHGVSRRTWYRQHGTGQRQRGTGPRHIKLIKAERALVPKRSRGGSRGVRKGLSEKKGEKESRQG